MPSSSTSACPGISGFDVIKDLRGWSDSPIIVLSARVGSGRQGARARCRRRRLRHQAVRDGRAPGSAPRRAAPHLVERGGSRSSGPTTSRSTSVPRPRRRIIATFGSRPTEWRIVEVLVARAGQLVTNAQLLQSVWGPDRDRSGQHAARPPGAHTAQARADPVAAPVLRHRSRSRLPLPVAGVVIMDEPRRLGPHRCERGPHRADRLRLEARRTSAGGGRPRPRRVVRRRWSDGGCLSYTVTAPSFWKKGIGSVGQSPGR